MSIFKINKTDFQSITVATNPSRNYFSSSNGITGDLNVFARRSKIEKETFDPEDPSSTFDDESTYLYWLSAKNDSSTNRKNKIDSYLYVLNKDPISKKKNKKLEILRYSPPYFFETGSVKKSIIRENLSSYYRSAYPSSHWSYSNYHCLNFFSSSTVPSSSVLLYPNDDDGTVHEGYAYGRYALSGAFSFDFYINPRYRNLDNQGHFKAGTIFHLSSSYALSLITGSAKDINGLPSAFRLQLQLSHSADISPSLAMKGNYPSDLVFLSEDNCLKWNHWHHVVVRWGTNNINHGTGSFNVDGIDRGTFNLPSGTIAPLEFTLSTTTPVNPDVLCVGNYYEGNNTGNNRQNRFFANDISKLEGLNTLVFSAGIFKPDSFAFNHPLQAELHDLSIKRFYVTDVDIQASSSYGLSDLKNVSFYLPPFFTQDSPIRYSDSSFKSGGVFIAPNFKFSGMTNEPFSLPLSFGAGGHYINTENFLKDFASNHHPRQLFLSGTTVDESSNTGKSANEILYSQPAVRKRNLLILPCDDGNFYPNYDILKQDRKILFPISANNYIDQSITKNYPSSVDDLGIDSPGFINLNYMLAENKVLPPPNPLLPADEQKKQQDYKAQIGFTPEEPLLKLPVDDSPQIKSWLNIINKVFSNSILNLENLYIEQKKIPTSTVDSTLDSSSNQVTFFDISNLFYGIRILPGSFTITDSSLSGSGGAVGITIKDDGNGTLYRGDSLTNHSTWNSVGTIFYNEGIVAIKSPHLYFFGKEQFEISFKGEQNLHVLRFETIAPVNHLNSSSNPSYRQVPSTNRPNEQDKNFVYITGINFHDDNLNVVMKTQLAQPMVKRHSEKIMFKIKYDF
jgi:hypothetical protein